MKDQKENTVSYFGTLLLMVLFFFLIISFPNRSNLSDSRSSRIKGVSEVVTHSSGAVVADAVQMPSLQKSCLRLLFNDNINLFSETSKIVADNRSVSRCLASVEKNEFVIKPLLLFRFYFPHQPSGSEEFPSLS